MTRQELAAKYANWKYANGTIDRRLEFLDDLEQMLDEERNERSAAIKRMIDGVHADGARAAQLYEDEPAKTDSDGKIPNWWKNIKATPSSERVQNTDPNSWIERDEQGQK